MHERKSTQNFLERLFGKYWDQAVTAMLRSPTEGFIFDSLDFYSSIETQTTNSLLFEPFSTMNWLVLIARYLDPDSDGTCVNEQKKVDPRVAAAL